MKKLLIITRITDIQCAPFILDNFKCIREGYQQDWSQVDYQIVFNLDKIEHVPSMILRRCSELGIIINFSYNTNHNDVLNEVFKGYQGYEWYYVLDETQLLNEQVFVLLSKADDIVPVLVGQQKREDEENYPYETRLDHATGIIDFGQVLFSRTALNYVLGFVSSNRASGETIDKILRFYNGNFPTRSYQVEVYPIVVNERNSLKGPSKSSMPKIVVDTLPSKFDQIKIEYLKGNAYSITKAPFRRTVQNQDWLYEAEVRDELNIASRGPVISIYTSAYNTKDRIYQTYESIRNQTFCYWEWVIVNDSEDGGETQAILESIAREDPRVKVYQFTKPSRGSIGEAKYRAAGLCKGSLIAEMDHDDLIASTCLEYIVRASEKFTNCGFFYTDCTEIDQTYKPNERYPEGFALGYGSYREEEFAGLMFDVQNTVPTNPLTIRHIVGVPNHMRVWRKEIYDRIGGYNQLMRIADDYELIVRTFLETKFCRIPRLLYFQRYDGNNSQDNGNRMDIQYRVKVIADYYRKLIKNRFEELGVPDFVDEKLDKVPELWYIPRQDGYNVNEVYEEEL